MQSEMRRPLPTKKTNKCRYVSYLAFSGRVKLRSVELETRFYEKHYLSHMIMVKFDQKLGKGQFNIRTITRNSAI